MITEVYGVATKRNGGTMPKFCKMFTDFGTEPSIFLLYEKAVEFRNEIGEEVRKNAGIYKIHVEVKELVG